MLPSSLRTDFVGNTARIQTNQLSMLSPVYENRAQQSDQRHDMSQVHPQPLFPLLTCRVNLQLLEFLGTALGCLAFMAFIRRHRHLVPPCAARSILPFVCQMRQVPPASGALLCSVFLFLRGRYYQPLAPLCAVCCLSCLSCAAGTTSFWCPSVPYVFLLAW